jgi:hypothetical protein
MKLYKIKKCDDFLWERSLKVIKIGKYWLLDFSIYEESFDNFGIGFETNLSFVYPISGHFAGLWIRLNGKSFHVSLLSECNDLFFKY